MNAALDAPEAEVRLMTVNNLLRDKPALDLVIPLLSRAFADSSDQVRLIAHAILSHRGREATATEIQHLEREFSGSPHELVMRIVALGYYFIGQRESDEARDRRNQHIFWLIQHAPETKAAGSPEAGMHGTDGPSYATAKQLWLDQVETHPGNTKVLGNAASFFLLNDKPLCESLLLKARDLEPSNPVWRERLGQLHSLRRGRDPAERQKSARDALQELRTADRLRSEAEAETENGAKSQLRAVQRVLQRMFSLPQLATAAYEAGELEVAKNYALELRSIATGPGRAESFRDDDALHHAHMILGKIALEHGDLHQARERLLASGNVSGSPPLKSFGPNMSLAKDLLKRGERDVVLEYFALCEKFWERGTEALQEWASQVQAGEIPDFGPNLRY